MKKKQTSAGTLSNNIFRTRSVVLIIATVTVLSGLYFAGESSKSGTAFSQQNSIQDKSKKKRFRATRDLIIDETTGTPRKPTERELDELLSTLEKLANTSTEGLQEYPLENGGYGMDLQGRFQGVFLSRPKPDGNLEIKCVFTFEEGLEFLGVVEESAGTSGS